MFTGVYTALITPFKNDQVDYKQLKQNVLEQIEAGVDGVVPMGTTGECPTVSHDEHDKIIETVVKAADGKVKVIAGTGSNSTAEALRLTRNAKAVGADAALMVNPYYNKPSQEGLYQHFMTIADEVSMEIVLYNIPGRTNITMAPDTVARLAKHEKINTIKEATGSMDIASEILSKCDITVLSGDDGLTLPLMSLGGKGVISVLSNLLPARVKQMVDTGLSGDFASAAAQHLELFPLFTGIFCETNPVPIKAALAHLGKDTGDVRLPLCKMTQENADQFEQLLKAHNII